MLFREESGGSEVKTTVLEWHKNVNKKCLFKVIIKFPPRFDYIKVDVGTCPKDTDQ